MQLSNARRATGFGMSPLTLTDIDAWQRMMRVRLTGWELETILAIDVVTLSVLSKHRKRSE